MTKKILALFLALLFASDAYAGGPINITAPTSSTVVYKSDNTYSITWDTGCSTGTFKVQYSDGSSWNTISNCTTDNGTCSWSLTGSDAPTTNQSTQIQMCYKKGGGTCGTGNTCRTTSDNFTFIAGSITVTSPNGTESWTAGTTQNIIWNSTYTTNVKIEYSTDSGSSWTEIEDSTTADTGSYSWAIPSTINSTTARIRVSDADSSYSEYVRDNSDADFTISAPATITITTDQGSSGQPEEIEQEQDSLETGLTDEKALEVIKNCPLNLTSVSFGTQSTKGLDFVSAKEGKTYTLKERATRAVINSKFSSSSSFGSTKADIRAFVDGIKVGEAFDETSGAGFIVGLTPGEHKIKLVLEQENPPQYSCPPKVFSFSVKNPGKEEPEKKTVEEQLAKVGQALKKVSLEGLIETARNISLNKNILLVSREATVVREEKKTEAGVEQKEKKKESQGINFTTIAMAAALIAIGIGMLLYYVKTKN